MDTLAMVMRERFKLQRQVKIFTAEGRLSSYALTAMPLLGLVGMYIFNPNYLMPLFKDPSGQKALAFVGVLQIIGHIVISKIIKIKV